jgi:hypothetical protein
MNFTQRLAVVIAALLVAGTTWAAPMEVAGVKFEEPLTVGGAPLQLNGAGIRYKAIFKVYAAGLYLGKKAATPEEVLAASGPKRVAITMLRDIDSNELGRGFTRGIEDNTPRSELGKLLPGLMRMSQVFSDQKKLLAGETFTLDWIPGTGGVLTVKGKVQSEPFKEQEFFNAILRIWLGQQPADTKLKDSLLGIKPV